MKNTLLAILSLTIATTTWASEDAKQLFYKAFTNGDKKAKALIESKYASTEYADVFKVYAAIPDTVELPKTKAALQLAEKLVARAPEFDVAYFVRASLRFDLANQDVDNEKVHATAMAADLQKAISLGISQKMPKAFHAQLELMQCFGDYIGSSYESALAHCDAGLKLDKSDEGLHKYRALTLYMMKDYAAAVKSFNQALKKDPKDTYLLNLRGISKLQSQDFNGALADATSGKKINANAVEFVILAGRAKVAMKNRVSGCQDLRTAAAMGYGADAQVWFNELCQ